MSVVAPQPVPLRRLLKRKAAQTLLADFQALMPAIELALFEANGSLYVCTAGWTVGRDEQQANLIGLLNQSQAGQIVRSGRFWLRPLLAEEGIVIEPVGTLVVQSAQPAIEPDWPNQVLRCLYRSLDLLLLQTLEKRAVVSEALERYREINLLYQVGETIGACLDPDTIPQLVLSEAGRVIQAEAGIVSLRDIQNQDQLKAGFGLSDYTETLYTLSHSLVEQVQQTGHATIKTVAQTNDPSLRANRPIRAVLCAPLKTTERILGAVLLGRLEGQAVFTAGDEKLVAALADQAAIALEKAWLHRQELKRQRLEEELSVSRRIQRSFLPQASPIASGWEFAALYEAAQQIGGDLYDFFDLPGEADRLGLVIADVTGKGVPAALFMAFARAVFRTEAISDRNPAAILARANQLIVQDNRTKLLLSALYATLNLDTGRLTYASAGHHWPLWYQADTGVVQELEVLGMILGVFPQIELEERTTMLASGDQVVFFTDGVIEAMDIKQRMFGEDRLHAVITAHAQAGAADMVQAIVKAVKAFTGDTPQSDDFTLVVVKRQ